MGMKTPAEEKPSRVLAITERELNKANVGFLALGAFVALLSICTAGIIREGVNCALPHLSPGFPGGTGDHLPDHVKSGTGRMETGPRDRSPSRPRGNGMTTERYKSEPKIILERAVKYSARIKTDQGAPGI